MKKIKKVSKKTRANISMVFDNLNDTIQRRLKLMEKYIDSDDPNKQKIALALKDNIDALTKVRDEITDIEQISEEKIFGD